MPEELPVICSLGGADLQARLATIGEVGAASLIDRRREGATHLLRFRSDADTRERLEGIVAAEAECCAFLDLRLTQGCCHLELRVAAPEAGQATADGFALAFASGTESDRDHG